MSSPGPSSGTPKPADPFEDLWRQLGESHHNTLQELEAKVSKLKKERCLDAQRLEVFYNRTQQLKEQNKGLQDAVSLLEERLREGECDRCAILGENLKNNQDQNLRLIAKLKSERNSLEDENRKLQAEVQKLKTSLSSAPRQASSPEQEEGFIPDSPILPSSLPVANKLKKRKNIDRIKHFRYAEMPLPQSNRSLFSDLNKEPVDATRDPGRAEVLVPNTCELDASQISSDVDLNLEYAVAETCGLELLNKPLMKTETTAGQRRVSKSPSKFGVRSKPSCSSPSATLITSPDSTTEGSPSLLPRAKRFSEDRSINKAKRKKEESEPDVHLNKATPLSNQSFKKEPVDVKVQSSQTDSSSLRRTVSCVSPVFKKPNIKGEANRNGAGGKGNPPKVLNASHQHPEGHDDSALPAERKLKVEPMWSIDPALALSMYDSEWRGDEEAAVHQDQNLVPQKQFLPNCSWPHQQRPGVPSPPDNHPAPLKEEEECPGELADTDCTWVSHSLLQGRGENVRERRDSVSGLGEKANDSLDMMFDTTAHGEHKSYNSSYLGESQPCDDHDEDDEEEGEEDNDPHENTLSRCKEHKAGQPAFAHVAVVRKKDERRKLKGTTCKECEIYYAHLPEEEKQKKLSSCSRHRFLYIPPCTPENFWEVGFPSTQTCIDRGYIREEKTPQARSRRRQPFNVLFSPKRNKQES